MKRKFKGGLTSVSLPVFIADTSSTTGGGLSGVTSASSGLVLEYRRAGQSTWTSVTPQAGKTLGSYLSGGIVADGSLSGAYEVDFPDAAFASNARMVLCRIRGVTNMLAVLIEIELDAVDYQDAAAFGLSRIDQTIGSRATQTSVDTVASYIDTEVAAIKAKTDNLPSDPADASDIATSFGTVNSTLSTIASYVDTEVAAIKAKTDLIAAFPANFSAMVINAGNGHVAAALHNAQPNSIPEDAFATGALSARALAADAANEIATAVSGIQVISRLDSMLEDNGSGQFRFDTIALEMAPAGGGGGGTDWTANERTAIRAILGVPTSGTTPTDPTTGILDTIRDSVGAIGINVYPVSASTPERAAGTTITYYRNEIRTVSVVTDFTLTSLTLTFTVEDSEGTDLLTIANASISRSGQTFTVSIGTAVTATISNYRWALRDITGGSNSVIARGVLTVQEAASA